MGGIRRKRGADGGIIPGPSDLKARARPDRDMPGRRNGSEEKRTQARHEEVGLLVGEPGVLVPTWFWHLLKHDALQ